MTVTSAQSTSTVVVAPNYRLAACLAIIATVISVFTLWVGLPLLLFSIFLLIQTATLRLHFTPTTLEVYRGSQQIRQFPYADWYHWEIYWGPVPILFYFREVNSIHFLPILFNPATLRQCLTERCPQNQPQQPD